MKSKIKVFIVDDSVFIRKMFDYELSKDIEIDVIGSAPNPYEARDLIVKYRPDVLILDIEMPKMNGLTFLEKIMKHMPMPVIIVSSLTPKGSEMAMKALELGAVDVIPKPAPTTAVRDIMNEVIATIKSSAGIKKFRQNSNSNNDITISAPKSKNNKIIAIGASTGGTEAIKNILVKLPSNMPPILIVQHMPPVFTNQFAQRLNSLCKINVSEATDKEILEPGKALVAPGDFHMVLKRERVGASFYVDLKKGPKVHRQRPSVEVLFNSVAKYAGKDAVGVLLTGMGRDGAAGLLEMKNAGAHTIAQNEETSLIFGMPGEAVRLGAAKSILPINRIPYELCR